MTKTVQLNSWKGGYVPKLKRRGPSWKTVVLALLITAAVAALASILQACGSNASQQDVSELKNKLGVFRVTLTHIEAQQAAMDAEQDSLFTAYRHLHKQYLKLDSIAFAQEGDTATMAEIKIKQAQITANMAALVNSMQTLGQLFTGLQDIVYSLQDEVLVLEARVNRWQSDTVWVREYVGDGNLIYNAQQELQPGDTLSFVIDSARFKIWHNGGNVEPLP